MAFILPARAIAGDAASVANDPHYQAREILQGYPSIPARAGLPPRPGQFADRYQGVRMTLADYDKLGDADAEKIAAEAGERGFTYLLTEANRYLFYRPGEEGPLPTNSHPQTLEEMIANGRRLADACHRHGIRYILHVTCTMVSQDYLNRHPQYASLDLRTGKQVQYAGRALVCIANPDFEKDFLQRLERLIQGTGADGAMVDEVAFWGATSCGCDACRARFTRETGMELPQSPGKDFFGNSDNPVYVAWLRWRTGVTQAMSRHITDLVHKYHGVRLNYRATLMPERYPYLRSGYFISDVIDTTDLLGYESEPPGYTNGGYLRRWPLVLACMKNLRAMGGQTRGGGAPWVLFYPKSVSDYTWTWLLARSQGLRLWWRPGMEPAWQPLLNWERNHEALLENVHPVANIGLLLSSETALRGPAAIADQWNDGFVAASAALCDSHLPFRVVLDRDMTPQRLAAMGINTLFLPNAACLSDRQARTIRQFVQSGGTLIASADTSLYDGGGQRRDDMAMSDVLGVSYLGANSGRRNRIEWTASTPLSPHRQALRHDRPFTQVRVTGGSAVADMIDENGKRFPGVVIHPFGQGRSIYFAGQPALKYAMASGPGDKIEPGQRWTDPRDDGFRQLLARAAAYGHQPTAFVADNFCKGVVVDAVRQEAGGIKGVQVLLTNLAGGNLQSGIVPMLEQITFPDVAAHRPDPSRPMTVALPMETAPQKVYVFSPDFADVVELTPTFANGLVRVAIPNVYRHEIVYFLQEGAAEALKAGGGSVTRQWPAARPLLYQKLPPLVGAYDPAAQVAFAEDFEGGRPMTRDERFARVIYGKNITGMKATLKLSSVPASASLVVGGMNANAPRAGGVPIEVVVNGRTIFTGPSPFPDAAWSTHTFSLPAGLLKRGDNMVDLRNTDGSGRYRYAPWLAVNFIKIVAAK
jgi:hypothetical protein